MLLETEPGAPLGRDDYGEPFTVSDAMSILRLHAEYRYSIEDAALIVVGALDELGGEEYRYWRARGRPATVSR